VTTTNVPPRSSIDSFRDRKWKEYVSERVSRMDENRVSYAIAGNAGNVTINKVSGLVMFPPGVHSLTLTNNLIVPTSVIMLTVRTSVSGYPIRVSATPSNGSAAIVCAGAEGLSVEVMFVVFNAS